MHTHHDAKAMAKILKTECDQRGLKLTHSESLEIVAKQFGLKNWNVLAAMVEKTTSSDVTRSLFIPDGWKVGGNAPHLFDLGMPSKESACLVIKRTPDSGSSIGNRFATLMQVISAEKYIGQTMMLSAELKTENVGGAATIWLRVDDSKHKVLEFNNLERVPLNGSMTGNNDWLRRKILMTIPEGAATIHFGFYLRGLGAAFGRNFLFEPYSSDNQVKETPFPEVPVNLSLIYQ
ncbi:MAG: glyoxalase superfamily protein [Beijerinckiaceae bacterium]